MASDGLTTKTREIIGIYGSKYKPAIGKFRNT
jgi:hypothetical protein